jgi:valyl-tRNA synthetase
LFFAWCGEEPKSHNPYSGLQYDFIFKGCSSILKNNNNDDDDVVIIFILSYYFIFSGMDRLEARKKLWADLEETGLAVKKEPQTLRVPRSQRGGEV